MAQSDDRLQGLSIKVLRDLGMTDQAIGAYLGRYGLEGRRGGRGGVPELGPGEPAAEAPFAGGYWHWGVRARHSDFW